MEGLYEGWSHPVQSGRIQFTSLPPRQLHPAYPCRLQ
ncbi:hypothetical protein NXW38_08840 [Bacteroides ovatus]|nr:hypothetical protein [Bacteroides ovatus]